MPKRNSPKAVVARSNRAERAIFSFQINKLQTFKTKESFRKLIIFQRVTDMSRLF